MNKNILALVLIILASFCFKASAQTDQQLYLRVERCLTSGGDGDSVYNNPYNNAHHDAFRDLSWANDEIRERLYSYIRNTAPKDLPGEHAITPEDALFYLGEPKTVQEEVDAYRKRDGRAMPVGGPPDLLPYLIEDSLHGATEVKSPDPTRPPPPNGQMYTDYIPPRLPLMDSAVTCAIEIIENLNSFPKATRDWASSERQSYGRYGMGPQAAQNKLLNEWWAHNKEAVLARRYQDASWLPKDIPSK